LRLLEQSDAIYLTAPLAESSFSEDMLRLRLSVRATIILGTCIRSSLRVHSNQPIAPISSGMFIHARDNSQLLLIADTRGKQAVCAFSHIAWNMIRQQGVARTEVAGTPAIQATGASVVVIAKQEVNHELDLFRPSPFHFPFAPNNRTNKISQRNPTLRPWKDRLAWFTV